MNIFNYLDEEKGTEYVWYKSDNLMHSVAITNNDGTVNLKIVFNNGATYLYYNVDAIDYTHMKSAESNGKAFSIFIAKKIDDKPKYMYKRISDTNVQAVSDMMTEFQNKAFDDAQKQQEKVEEEIKDEIKHEDIKHAPSANHKLDFYYDQMTQKAVAVVDGEKVADYPCLTQNDFARVALFLAPIVSYLGYPIKINVGD